MNKDSPSQLEVRDSKTSRNASQTRSTNMLPMDSISIYDRIGKLSKGMQQSLTSDTRIFGNTTGANVRRGLQSAIVTNIINSRTKDLTEETQKHDPLKFLHGNSLGLDMFGDADSEEDDDLEDDLESKSLIDIYAELPPPSIPMIPFKFFNEFEDYDLTNRKHFNALKMHLDEYVDLLHEKLNAFNHTNDTLFPKDRNQKSIPKSNDVENTESDKEQPTTIQLLKALEKANRIVNEVERSHKISEYKAMKQKGIYK